VLNDLVGGWAVVLEDVVLSGAGGGDEFLNNGLGGGQPWMDV